MTDINDPLNVMAQIHESNMARMAKQPEWVRDYVKALYRQASERTVKANVVIIVIAIDGSISAIGPFISPQQASRHVTEHPELSPRAGIEDSRLPAGCSAAGKVLTTDERESDGQTSRDRDSA